MQALLIALSIALAHLKVRVRQTAVSALGVTVGVSFFVAVGGMTNGQNAEFTRTLIESAPHIIVTDESRSPHAQPAESAFRGDAVAIHGVRPEDEVRGLKDWPAMLADARAITGAVASATLSGAVSVRFAGRTEGLALTGIDPRVEGRLVKIEDTLKGGRLQDLEARPDGILITRPLAQRIGAHVGDTLVVVSPAGVLQRMRVIALIEPNAQTGFYAGDNVAYALLRTAQVLFARPNVVNQLHIKVADPQTAQATAERLEARWGYKWQSWQERSRDILNLVLTRFISGYAIIGVILLVAAFGIYTAVSTSVTEKRRDIAILRAMGFTEADVQRTFLFEGVAVAAIGCALGSIMGALMLDALSRVVLKLPSGELKLPIDHGITPYLVGVAAALGSAAVAAWLPARKASAVDPVEILRGAA